MPISHRNTDKRLCGAKTVVVEQDFVYINDELWAVHHDPNSHGAGFLVPDYAHIFIEDKRTVLVNDPATADKLCPVSGGFHCHPDAATGDELVEVI